LLPRAGAACVACRLEQTPLQELRAVCVFDGPARDAVHALKYDGMFSVAEPLAQLMVARYPRWSEPVDLIVPVPLHPERVRERGYNQATLLARRLCEPVGVPLDDAALWRTRHTRPQVGLDRAERRQNVQGAFAAERERVEGMRILLVDDVCTSGATLASAATALLEAGAVTVRGYCFARPAAT
jgi:ComF family protein